MRYNPFDVYTDEYEKWFKENENTFQSELLAVRQLIPIGKKGIEIGIGSGIFAEQLNIKFGIDPSDKMLEYARRRNLTVIKGFAEDIPYSAESFDFVAFITSICFIENPDKAINEAYRILRKDGEIILAFIDKHSKLGQTLDKEKDKNKFYSSAFFYSVSEIVKLIEKNEFKVTEIIQTLTNINNQVIEHPLKGFGKGSFIVIKANK
jgi:ubiquinone/menaquinone biosynthesis C-methylase UbiE